MTREYHFTKPTTTVFLEDDHVIFRRGQRDIMIHKMLRGDTTVRYSEILGIKFSEPTRTSQGYLQLNTPRTSMLGVIRTVDQPQNAVMFKRDRLEDASEVKRFIEEKLRSIAASEPPLVASLPDQLRELKSMYDEGLVTESEYEAKRAQLLGI